MSFIAKTYEVRVEGWQWMKFVAASAARARTVAWRAYCAFDAISYREFLGKSRVRVAAASHPDFGLPVMIGGERGYLVSGDGNAGGHVAFVRDDSDVILYSHPADVVR
jgi:hypothetical protein